MPKRTLLVVLVYLVAACSGQGGGPGAASTGPQATSDGAGPTPAPNVGGASLAAAAANVTDWCALIPNDVVQRFAPGAPAVTAGTYPGECVASNGVGALDFRFTTGFGPFEVPSGAETIAGLGESAYLNRPSADEVELWVALQADPEVSLFIDVAGHDGKDHKDDAVAIAQAIIAKLGGG